MIVLDEADKLLELGFDRIIEEIVKNANPTRQTLLFSATLSSNVHKLVKICMKTPIRLAPNLEHIVAEKL